MKRDISIGLLAFALGACVTSPSLSPAEKLAADMVGTFETAIGSDDAMRDRRIEIAALGTGEWLYYQVNHKSDLWVYRQRILQLEALPDGRVQQTAWTINDAAAHVDLWDKPDMQATLSQDDLTAGLEDGCAQIWTREDAIWAGKVNPDTCIITSTRRGSQIRIGAESLLDEGSLSLAERGFDLAGEQLWGTEPGDYYRLIRVD